MNSEGMRTCARTTMPVDKPNRQAPGKHNNRLENNNRTTGSQPGRILTSFRPRADEFDGHPDAHVDPSSPLIGERHSGLLESRFRSSDSSHFDISRIASNSRAGAWIRLLRNPCTTSSIKQIWDGVPAWSIRLA